MADVQAILSLHASRYSGRRISELLGLDRETVRKQIAAHQNPPNAPSGSDPNPGAPVPKNTPASGPVSACAEFREVIERKLEQGITAERIYQDLVDEQGYSGSYCYYSVRRFVSRLVERTELPVRRLETRPGEEAQIDFGTGAMVRGSDGSTFRPWAFRIVLSYSRRAYSEAVRRQTSEAFIGALEVLPPVEADSQSAILMQPTQRPFNDPAIDA